MHGLSLFLARAFSYGIVCALLESGESEMDVLSKKKAKLVLSFFDLRLG